MAGKKRPLDKQSSQSPIKSYQRLSLRVYGDSQLKSTAINLIYLPIGPNLTKCPSYLKELPFQYIKTFTRIMFYP